MQPDDARVGRTERVELRRTRPVSPTHASVADNAALPMKLAVIGGSSLVTFDPQDAFSGIGLTVASRSDEKVETSYGEVHLKKFELTGAGGLKHTLYFMQRHSHGSSGGIESGITPPHHINYHANVKALSELGVEAVVATTSVGTILPTFPPGRVGVMRQYIDFTGAATTFFPDDAKFTSVINPFDEKINVRRARTPCALTPPASPHLPSAAPVASRPRPPHPTPTRPSCAQAALLKTLRAEQKLDDAVQLEFVYWLSVGPQYETPAEINAIERMGGEVVGMTAPREAKLCAELALPYSCLAIASNWAAGRTPGDASKALDHAEVSETSKNTTGIIVSCLVELLRSAS